MAPRPAILIRAPAEPPRRAAVPVLAPLAGNVVVPATPSVRADGLISAVEARAEAALAPGPAVRRVPAAKAEARTATPKLGPLARLLAGPAAGPVGANGPGVFRRVAGCLAGGAVSKRVLAARPAVCVVRPAKPLPGAAVPEPRPRARLLVLPAALPVRGGGRRGGRTGAEAWLASRPAVGRVGAAEPLGRAAVAKGAAFAGQARGAAAGAVCADGEGLPGQEERVGFAREDEGLVDSEGVDWRCKEKW